MPTIDQCVRAIRQAVYGRDVREAIASGIEQSYSYSIDGVTIANDAAMAVASISPEAELISGENYRIKLKQASNREVG